MALKKEKDVCVYLDTEIQRVMIRLVSSTDPNYRRNATMIKRASRGKLLLKKAAMAELESMDMVGVDGVEEEPAIKTHRNKTFSDL